MGFFYQTLVNGRPLKTFSIHGTHDLILRSMCARPNKTLSAKKFFTKEDDALTKEWDGVCWMNPPYGREIKTWVKKAYETAQAGDGTVVCLLPSRTDTAWWHDYCMKGEVTFIRGRLKFGGSKNSAPFPSAVVVFYGGKKENER